MEMLGHQLVLQYLYVTAGLLFDVFLYIAEISDDGLPEFRWVYMSRVRAIANYRTEQPLAIRRLYRDEVRIWRRVVVSELTA